MIDWIKSWFGQGHIVAEFVCLDGRTGRVRLPYVGSPDTFDHDEFVAKVREEIWFKTGRQVATIRNVRFV